METYPSKGDLNADAALGSGNGDGSETRLERRHFRLTDRRTSISLHSEEWAMLEDIADRESTNLKNLVNTIDAARGDESVPSAVRLYLLNYWRNRISAN